jgi:hypothetical protein
MSRKEAPFTQTGVARTYRALLKSGVPEEKILIEVTQQGAIFRIVEAKPVATANSNPWDAALK